MSRKKDGPIVSVIMPCYNCQNTLDIAFESLNKQTYQNIEVICVNDGSTDRTEEILNKWKAMVDFDVLIISQENGGVSKARNKGLLNARGKYICFLDADDAYNDHYIEALVCAINFNDSDVAYCKLSRDKQKALSEVPNVKYVVQSTHDAMNNLLYHMGDFGFYCYIYKSSILKSKNLLFDEETKYGEDREFIWKYIAVCSSIVYLDRFYYWYFENNASATMRKATWRNTDAIHAIRRTDKYLKENRYPYYKEFNRYMNARVMWAVAKAFAVSNDRKLYKRLMKEFNVKKYMKVTAKDNAKAVRFASKLYLVNPWLFFVSIGLYGKISNAKRI